MKTIITTLFILTCWTSLSFAQPTAYKMQIGDQLIYHVEAGTNEYDFIVKPIKLSSSGISFDYEMTAPANRKGTINMSKDALESATAMYNNFDGGSVNLTDQVSVFASKAMLNAAAEGLGGFYLDGPDGDAEDFTTLQGNTSELNNSTYLKLVKTVAGKEYSLDGPIMENENGTKTVRFTDGGGFPFITYLQTNFTVYLTEIKRDK